MKTTPLFSVLALSLGFALACGGGEKAPDAPPPPPAAPVAAPAPAAPAGSVGVKECDDYIAKMEACLGAMDPAAKAAYESSFKQTKDAWVQAASTEAGKAGLAQACTMAANSMPANCGAGAATGTVTDAAGTVTATAGGAAVTAGAAGATATVGGTTVTAGATGATVETKTEEPAKAGPPAGAKAPSRDSVRNAASGSGGVSKDGGSGGAAGGASKK